MSEQDNTKDEPICELQRLRSRVAELERADADRERAEKDGDE